MRNQRNGSQTRKSHTIYCKVPDEDCVHIVTTNDERHICPLQLEVIRRAVKLWSNPGDTIWSPFAGIGSEGFVALEMGRKFVGSELKRSYWNQCVRNLGNALSASVGLFAGIEEDDDEPVGQDIQG